MRFNHASFLARFLVILSAKFADFSALNLLSAVCLAAVNLCILTIPSVLLLFHAEIAFLICVDLFALLLVALFKELLAVDSMTVLHEGVFAGLSKVFWNKLFPTVVVLFVLIKRFMIRHV